MNIILKPFAWLLLVFYNLFNNYGLALILFAIVIKIILFPFSLKGKRGMIQMNMLQGQVQKLQKQYANNKQKYNEEVQKLYEKEKVNPMSGCLWSFLPLLLLIPLYAIIRQPMQYMMNLSVDQITRIAMAVDWPNAAKSAGFIASRSAFVNGGYNELYLSSLLSDPARLAAAKNVAESVFSINFQFLGVNLAQQPSWQIWTKSLTWNNIGLFLMPLISAGLSVVMGLVSTKTNNMNQQNGQQASTNKMLLVFSPLMSLWIGYAMPAGLCVYWIINNLLSIGQEVLSAKMLKKDYEAAAEAQRKREILEKEEEKRKKEALAAERARRIAEKKVGKKKKDTASGVNPSASREGLRAYARGRSYDPNRYGGVTPYKDPQGVNEDAIEEALEKRAKAKEEAQLEAEIDARIAAEVERDFAEGKLTGEAAEQEAEAAEEPALTPAPQYDAPDYNKKDEAEE